MQYGDGDFFRVRAGERPLALGQWISRSQLEGGMLPIRNNHESFGCSVQWLERWKKPTEPSATSTAEATFRRSTADP